MDRLKAKAESISCSVYYAEVLHCFLGDTPVQLQALIVPVVKI